MSENIRRTNIPIAGTNHRRRERIYPYRAPIAEEEREYSPRQACSERARIGGIGGMGGDLSVKSRRP
eukprot:3366326-Pyramimonas_sp.AAC.1